MAHQPALAEFLCPQIGMDARPDDLRLIGRERDGRIVGAVGFCNWTARAVEMHCAGIGQWLTRGLLRAAFRYPFVLAGKAVVIATVGSGNDRALRLNRHLGFREDGRIEGAHTDGALVIMSMRRAECRWLED